MLDITRWPSYLEISELDPLSFNEQSIKLPSANENHDTDWLRLAYAEMLGAAEEDLADVSAGTAVAALRDLDFIASSLIRHNQQETAQSEQAARIFTSLGRLAGTVPRGTVFTYASTNPEGERERSFTGSPQERLFINAVRRGIEELDLSLDRLAGVAEGELSGIYDSAENLANMVASIIDVKKGVSPAFFTFELRPYFEPMTIDGETYAAAGGAQMQLVAIDRLVWGSDCKDPVYQEYFSDNFRYLTPDQRGAVTEFERRADSRSIVSLLEEGEIPSALAFPINQLLLTLKRFRYPHRRVARDNFALRQDSAVGSGRYSPDVLDHLISLTDAAIERTSNKL